MHQWLLEWPRPIGSSKSVHIVLLVMVVLNFLFLLTVYPGIEGARNVDNKAAFFLLIQKNNIWLIVINVAICLWL